MTFRLDKWRAAEDMVAARWEQYTAAPPEVAAEAYAAYVAALDAEEAAAHELQHLSLNKAA